MTKWQDHRDYHTCSNRSPSHHIFLETKTWNKNDQLYPTKHVFFWVAIKVPVNSCLHHHPKNMSWHTFHQKKRFSYSPRDPCIMVILTYINTTNQKSTHSWMGKNIPVRPMEILCVGCVFLPTNSRISIDLIIHPSSTFPKVLRANANSLGKPSSVVVAENLWDECFGWEIFVVKKPAQKFNYKKNRSWW